MARLGGFITATVASVPTFMRSSPSPVTTSTRRSGRARGEAESHRGGGAHGAGEREHVRRVRLRKVRSRAVPARPATMRKSSWRPTSRGTASLRSRRNSGVAGGRIMAREVSRSGGGGRIMAREDHPAPAESPSAGSGLPASAPPPRGPRPIPVAERLSFARCRTPALRYPARHRDMPRARFMFAALRRTGRGESGAGRRGGPGRGATIAEPLRTAWRR